jgi:2-oxoisovalerate dehydrogenase E1 component beta subunit
MAVERTLVQAVNDGLETEMRNDDSVVVLGEDVGEKGGVFLATEDLHDEFGEDRVKDTPLDEAGIVGTAIGMALYGLRPVPEIQFQDFIWPAFNQIVSEMAKFRYRSGGQYDCPMVVRAPYGGGIRGGHYHSQSGEAYFAHTPGLKVAIPRNAHDAKGLLISSIRDPDPVMFFEPKRLYRDPVATDEIPEDDYEVPLGEAEVVREGEDVTAIAWGAMLKETMEAAEEAADQGVDVEVVDLRTILPFDQETVVESVRKTGRPVIVHEAPKTAGFGAELAATLAEKAVLRLECPIYRVCGFDTPFPYTLEYDYLPSTDRILDKFEQAVHF